ncbi:hypothetical protein MVES_002371 [Malassezia vespertilionis]|uniref:Gvp36p n=1 Tax=Malassezia vespertilionis TaxID=2020962 RepID=A0A2N1JB35_9BASI|nr:hypothetical protein MVES_002371 [Malassezia vespertilionis]
MDHFKSFTSNNQQARERFGHADDITELPEEYRHLEQRVDAMKNAHASMIRTVRVFEQEAYDYPQHLQETLSQSAQSIGHTLSSWASTAAKNTNMGNVEPTHAPETAPRTLYHALSRSATSAAMDLEQVPMSASQSIEEPGASIEHKLAELLKKLAVAENSIGNARLTQDRSIVQSFIMVWNAFGSQINLALKARQSVRDARLHLDNRRGALKHAEQHDSVRAESIRGEVEQAEDKLVGVTEEAISLMKAVLDNPEPVQTLASLVKAQLHYYRESVGVLEQLDQDMSHAATTAESAYRASRS